MSENTEIYKDFIIELKNLGYSDNSSLKKVDKAWEFTKNAHFGQKRLNGDDYAVHGLQVARIIANWKLDLTSIIAGILHDTVDDGAARMEDVEKEFGEEIAHLVDGVTKVSKLRLRGSEEEMFIENLRKMFLAMAKDLRVVLIKLADRLHNMRTLEVLPADKRLKISKETVEVYAPLAERLGMGGVKSELNDLAFPYVFPNDYKHVKEISLKYYKRAKDNIDLMRRTLLRHLSGVGVNAKIGGRQKTIFSLWKKLVRPGIDGDFNKIYDIVALRILVDTVPDCYTTLGIVHLLYKLSPYHKISDFIAQPKPNGYQSIHTKVFGPGGGIVEIQIRTFEMHEQAEHGIAAHWAYSEVKSLNKIHDTELKTKGVTVSNKLEWVKQLASWQSEIKDSKEFLEAVKFDALSERIFVFSPKGDVYDLPINSTPVDFAYAVHTTLGNYINGAKLNGKVVPLSNTLNNGDVVEIIKSKNPKNPNSDWLGFVKTRTAKSSIKKRLKS